MSLPGARRRFPGAGRVLQARPLNERPGASIFRDPRPSLSAARLADRLMDLNEYQQLAARTLGRDRTHEQQLANAALGLAGEAGEVADTIKKHLFHKHPLDRDAMVKELGDIMWYVAAMATVLDVELAEIGERNIDKLRRRYPEGFSVERSLNRPAE